MVDVKNQRCGKQGCSEHPSFGAAAGKKAEFCATHTQAGMVQVVRKMCGKQGCSKRASFGAIGGKKAEFCAIHACGGMISVNGNECASQRYSNRAQEHGDTCHHVAYDLVMPSDAVGHDQNENSPYDEFIEGKTGVGIDEDCEDTSHPPGAVRSTSRAGLTAGSFYTSRAIRAIRRGAKSTTTPPAASRWPASAAAADEVISGGTET
ncbi:unnamed protein product, partial [Sphacelaria rigidula]